MKQKQMTPGTNHQTSQRMPPDDRSVEKHCLGIFHRQRRGKAEQRTELDRGRMAARVGYQHPGGEPDRSGAGMPGTENKTQAGGKGKDQRGRFCFTPRQGPARGVIFAVWEGKQS